MMKVREIPDSWAGSPRGYITASYGDMIRMFGEPNGVSGDGKTRAIWKFIIGESYFIIYDWKMYDIDLNDVIEWTVVCKYSDRDIIVDFLNSSIQEIDCPALLNIFE